MKKNSSTPITLNRNIGLFALILYGIGDILGAGIYGLVGKAAGQMGNSVWMAFLASMVAAGLTGLSYASLGSRFPKAGGASFITHRAFNRNWLAYAVGLAVLASGLMSMATATRVFSGYFQALIGGQIPLQIIIIGFALFLVFFVLLGIREALWVNSICTFIELGGLVIIIVFGLKFVGSVNYFDATTISNPTGDLSLSLILTGAVLTFYSFVGFEDILNVAEEVKNPQKTLPLGLILAVSIASLIYMLISVIAVSVIPSGLLAESKEPLVDVIRIAAPWFPPALYSVIAMFAVSNTALINFIMGSRLVYGMATQGLLPKSLAKVHPKRRTPHVAAGAIFVISLLLALSGDISSLAKSTSVLLLFSFILVNFSLVILKNRKNEPPGSFEVPSIIPILGSLVCAMLLFSAEKPELMTAGIILAVIAAFYFILKPRTEAIKTI
jgi:basic amino acid/polyamine antiporter, APA family